MRVQGPKLRDAKNKVAMAPKASTKSATKEEEKEDSVESSEEEVVSYIKNEAVKL